MPTISKILVPVDFSECSRKALRYGAMLAERFGASIDVVHVWEPPLYIFPDVMVELPGEPAQSLGEFAQEKAGAEMDAFLQATLDEEARGIVTPRVESGHPFHAIMEIIEQGNYDLMVMGTHGRTGLPHLLIGSLAEKIVRRVPCPVITIRAADPVGDSGHKA